jgi:hypothetical protein
MSVRLSVSISAVPTRWISVNFDTGGGISTKICREITKNFKNRAKISANSHEDFNTFTVSGDITPP